MEMSGTPECAGERVSTGSPAAMKVSNVAKGKRARNVVFKGGKAKTASGMTKAKLTMSKTGKIVSKAKSDQAKMAFEKALSPVRLWCEAVKQARRSMGSHGIQGFVAVGGKRAQGQALYMHAKRHYRALKRRTPRCWCCRINLRVAGECAPGLCAMCWKD